MSKFPERLRLLRHKKKINQTDLSKYLNYGYTAIANYESGRNEPSFDVLINIAQFFDVSVDYLLGVDDSPLPSHKLPYNELELLKHFRNLDENLQDSICNMIEIIANDKK